MRTCEEYEVLLSARLDGELTQEEANDLESHLDGCPACRKLAEELEGLHRDLSLLGSPAPDLADGILAKIAGETPKKKRNWKPWAGLAATVAVLAVILIPTLINGSPVSGDSASDGASEQIAMDVGDRSDHAPAPGTDEGRFNDYAEGEMATPADAAPLSREAAREALENWLSSNGRDLTLSSDGSWEEDGFWVFRWEVQEGRGILFYVAQDSGEIREVPEE